MSSKKASKSMFHGPVGGSFSQKKKASHGNVKHSDDEKNISLKSGSSASVYSNVESLSGNDKDVSMSGGFDGSLLDLAVNTPKTKHMNTNANFGSPIGSPDFEMDEEVAVKKSFALNINLSAVEGKSAMAKTHLIRKVFLKINGFGGATTPSKFEGIIRSTFTSEESMRKAVSLAEEEGIVVNNDVKKQGLRSDRAVVIKKIPMNTPKEIIVAAVFEFGQIKSIKIQLVGMWQKTVVKFAESGQAEQLASKWSFLIGKDFVHVTKAMGDRNIWASRDRFKVLLFMLLVGTTVHDLSNLLDKTGGRTYIINRSLDTAIEFAVLLNLVRCGKCGCLGHSALEYDALDTSSSDLLNNFNKKHAPGVNCLQLAKLYAKKNVPISRPAVFGGKSWAQVVSFASFSGGSSSGFGLGAGFSYHMTPDLGGGPSSSTLADSFLNAHLAFLERSLELLADQVSNILRKLSFVELVPMVPSSGGWICAFGPCIDMGSGFNSSSSKVLTTKVGGLKSKMLALEASVGSVLVRLDLLCTGSGSSLLPLPQ
ncbi:hypothetical protein G9A89_011873 [Geosiphon pyriformis]|nr:hypothetical protein G9A89_011873 [Geosiphon pyriformis]